MSEQSTTAALPDLIAEKKGAAGWLTFNRPERMNAVTYDMWCDIPDVIDDFTKDEDIRIIVLTGAGERA